MPAGRRIESAPGAAPPLRESAGAIEHVEALAVRGEDGVVPHTAGPGGQTDGVAFHGTGGYVVTNNTDGSITRLDFPAGDYSRPPVQTLLAAGGFRGDLVQVGADSCLYLTQDGARYGDGTVTSEQSIVRVCGGFVPPPTSPPGRCAGADPVRHPPHRRGVADADDRRR
jgi:hypothetical protein